MWHLLISLCPRFDFALRTASRNDESWMVLDLTLLLLGLGLLVGGGQSLVSGAAALARLLGVSPLVIGLTVVAFGTSAPELAVNALAVLQDNGGVAFGNLMGSNLANVGLIVGVAAIVRPLTIQSIVITREIPMMLLASLAALVMGLDALRGVSDWNYDRSDALMLLLLFGVFLYYTIGDTLRKRPSDPLVEQIEQRRVPRLGSAFGSAALVAAGLIALVAGGYLSVQGAVGVAEASIGPVPVGGLIDLVAVLATAAVLLVVCSTYGGRTVTHAEGWLLLVAYLIYIVGRAT